MKKSVRTLLILLAVLAVLGGAAACLLLAPAQTAPEEGASPAASEEPKETVTAVEPADVAAIKVENNEGSYTILPVQAEPAGTAGSSAESGGESSAAAVPEAAYTIEGLEGYDLETSRLKTAAEGLLSISANRSLGPQEDLGQYGLAGERAGKVTIEQKSGGTVELVLGDSTTGGTAGQYLLKDGQVYIVPALSDLLRGSSLGLVGKEVCAIPDWTTPGVDENGEATEDAMPDTLFKLTISGKAFAEPIEAAYVEKARLNGYLLTSPVVAEGGATSFDPMIAALKNLTADAVAAVGISGEGLAGYGLDEPDAAVTFEMNMQGPVTLLASAKDSSNNRYVMVEGRDVVYQVSNDKVSAWAEAKAMGLRAGTICLAHIDDVGHLSLTREGDMAYAFDIDLDGEEKTVKKAGGEEVPYEDYQGFFQQLVSLSVFSLEEAPHEGTPALRVEYQYEEGSDVVELFPIEGQDRWAVTLNGAYNGQVRGSEVSPLLEKLEALYA